MTGLIIAFVLAGLNPFGGMFVAVPLAMYKLDWPSWFIVLSVVPLAYAQVIVVDLLWDRLLASPRVSAFLVKRRSVKLESMLARPDATLWLTVAGPWLGPWLVSAAARFAGYRQSRIALPLLGGLTYIAIGTCLVCYYAPSWLSAVAP